jgi:hypothetical protein
MKRIESRKRWSPLVGLLLIVVLATPARSQPGVKVDSPVLLDLPGSGTDADAIDYAKLPVLKGTHAIISAKDPEWKFQLHNYLLHHDGRFWCMWSHGPGEDEPTQHIRYAVSDDGVKWGKPRMLTPSPKEGYAYIARGFWVRDGELLALVAHFKGKGAFGVNKELKLEAYVWDKQGDAWKYKGLVYDNAINSYPPQKLPTGEWMVSRRDARFNVSVLIGGVKKLDQWDNVFIMDFFKNKVLKPDEPIWWSIDNKTLSAVFRDNAGSGRLFRAFSMDQGRSWSPPIKTNYPNATSKVFSMQLSNGLRVLVGNANPKVGRRQLLLSVSKDGLVFTRMFLLDIPSEKPSTLQYPHVMEKDGKLYIAYSRNKALIEMFILALADLSAAGPTGGAGGVSVCYSRSPGREAMRYVIVIALLACVAASVNAQDKKKPPAKVEPRVLFTVPLGVPTGKATKVTVRGLALDDAKEVRVDQGTVKLLNKGKAGVPDKNPEKVGDTQVEIELKLDAGFQGDAVTLTVVTPTGETKPHRLLVEAKLPVMAEKEGNDGFRAAHAVTLPSVIEGTIGRARDVDVFRIEGKKGQRLTAEVLASRHGAPLDAILTLYDAEGRQLASNDDFSPEHRDARIEFTLPADGVYYLTLQDAHDTGSNLHVYRLVVR